MNTSIIAYDDGMMNFITADGDIYTLKSEFKYDFDRLNDGEGGWS